MGEKYPEVTGCDASIMKNVWEIRLREYGQKLVKETERSEKSALEKINSDWQQRMTSKEKYPSRKPRKPKPVEAPPASNTSYMNKRNTSMGSGASRAPSGFTASQLQKAKKGSAKADTKVQKLLILTLTQPPPMVWGKSWKYVKQLPETAEGAPPPQDWGKSWMFAALQPHLEGKSWTEQENVNAGGNNNNNNATCSMWEKTSRRMEAHYLEDSQHLEQSQPTPEWDKSWKYTKYQAKKEGGAESLKHRSGEDQPKSLMMLNRLAESQHHNESLSSSKWIESWKATKPSEKEADPSTDGPTNGLTNGPTNGPTNDPLNELKGGKQGSKFGESWKFINLQLHTGSSKSVTQASINPEWADSWKAAKMVSNDHPKSKAAEKVKNIYGAEDAPADSHLHKVILSIARDQKYRDIWSCQLRDEVKPLSEWEKSWLVTKTNVEHRHEESVKAEEKSRVTETPRETKPAKTEMSHGEPPMYEIIYSPLQHCKTEKFVQRVKTLEKGMSDTDWKLSWKSLRHQLVAERVRTRPSRSRPFREPTREETPCSEWAASWRLTNLTLNQQPDLWEQGWSTMPRARIDRALAHTHFVDAAVPCNGPISGRGWGESWRFTRSQHRSEAPQQGSASQQAVTLPPRRRSVGDWGESWMVCNTEYRNDRPSLTAWLDSWRCSAFHTDRWEERQPRHNWLDKSMEIKPRREKLPLQSAKAKMSRCFESKIFNERFPATEWVKAWKAPTFPCQGAGGLPATGSARFSESAASHTTSNNNVSPWGRSWRVANSMPHVDKPWLECTANQSQYAMLWSRSKGLTRSHLYVNLTADSGLMRQWVKSWRFLKVEIKSDSKSGKGKSTGSGNSMVIMTQRVKTRKHIYSNIDNDKPAVRKWTACQSIAKTQPRPKRGAAIMKSGKAEAEVDNSFYEEWMESWRFTNKPLSAMPASPAKSLSGWRDCSWKFLLGQYPQKNSAKKAKAP